MNVHVSFTQFAQSTPLFTLKEARGRYGRDAHSRSILNMLHRLKRQGRVQQLANGVYAGALAGAPLNRYLVPAALREDAVVALHSALEWHGVANQVFQTVYYFSTRPRKDVTFDNVTYHRVAPPRALDNEQRRLLHVTLGPDHVLLSDLPRKQAPRESLGAHLEGHGTASAHAAGGTAHTNMKFDPSSFPAAAKATGPPSNNLEKVLRLRELLTEFLPCPRSERQASRQIEAAFRSAASPEFRLRP